MSARVIDIHQFTWLDLCCGLKGASQPAIDRGWKVITVDIDPRFKPDIVADVRALPLRPFHVDVLWASPPCQEFSKFQMRCFFPNPPEPDLSISLYVREAIAYLSPRWWIVENVWASRRWLTKIFGPVACLNPGHAFWGFLPGLLPYTSAHKGSFDAKSSIDKRWGSVSHTERKRRHGIHGAFTKNDKHAAALIPYEIGEAICRAVEART